MESVMLSIKPKYCELIASGKKTIEVRKTKPKFVTAFKCYIYCTKDKTPFLLPTYSKGNLTDSDIWQKGNGKVIGEFVCDKIYQHTTCDAKNGVDISDEDMTRMSCLTKGEIRNYELSPGLFGVFGWHISDLVIYDEPKELSKFYTICKGGGNVKDKNCINCLHLCFDNEPINGATRWCGVHKRKPLTRPPQSWCYVEEV